ncbi:hypothetical protein PVAND_011954 [Polypedilum vanderplanki]|uniref:SH2 domain-containing protein n=1 Tax=Polypedilum vanderplanki TaxID=319348 RepID=A0A9J6CLT9_POLVA|nr:hypothetical protein PVAND_011954 [Polypedilum vanderplanki]
MVECYDRIDWNNEKAIEDFLSNGGITFNVAYAGCIEIKNSVKSLDSEMRTAIAIECINRIDDERNKRKIKRKKLDKRIRDIISDELISDYSDCRVLLTISYERFEILIIQYHEILAKHEVSNVSFASIGEGELAKYIGYVGKDVLEFRACYVLNCGSAKARRVIQAIRTVFQLRSKRFCNAGPNKITTYRRLSALPNIYELRPKQEPKPKLTINPSSLNINQSQLQNEIWFHGTKSREEAEEILKISGDFLVRKSISMPDQFILSCYNGEHYHLCLTNGEEKVRTNNKEFENINMFVEYHYKNNAPIIVPHDIEIFLIQPVIN